MTLNDDGHGVRSVVMPGRILRRHVGGNTTYARAVAGGLFRRGVTVRTMPFAQRAAVTALHETAAALRQPEPGSVLHYVADTGPLLASRWPTVVTVHGVASRWISTARTSRQEAVWRARVRRAVDAADQVVTVSESSARDVAEVFGVASDRLTTIPHGVDHALYGTDAVLSDEVRAAVPTEFLLYLGNLEPRKNLVELVRAHARVPEAPPLVIAGKPAWNAADSVRAIADSSRVVHLGFVSDTDKVALLRSCTAFVFPSLYEGFGFPVLEALAAGAPVITTDRGSLPEVSGPSWVVGGVTADELAEGLTAALADDAWLRRCREAGPGWSSRFTWARSVDAHLDVYRKALAS